MHVSAALEGLLTKRIRALKNGQPSIAPLETSFSFPLRHFVVVSLACGSRLAAL